MATWLNALLAGSYTLQVFRDGVVVEPSSVGASLTVASGVVTLQTPADESHQWDIRITPNIITALPMRLRAMTVTHPLGIATAQAIALSPGQSINLVTSPTVTPDPATFTSPGLAAGLSVVENP